MAGDKQCLVKILVCFLVIKYFEGVEAKPVAKGDEKVTMSGEPTHFQVDDKAAELEINANAMGVKVNAKPASLQVVSKPGAPAMAIPHPVVYAPPEPYHIAHAPYHIAPFYPPPVLSSPMVLGHRRTVRRRHHFFDMNPSTGNWNFKKGRIPGRGRSSKISQDDEQAKYISKKSEILRKSEVSKNSKVSRDTKDSQKIEKNSRKRQWIQQVPVLAQVAAYDTIPIRVHPLVQRLFASQTAMRNTVSRPVYALRQQIFSPLSQRSSFIYPGLGEPIDDLKRSVHRAIFLPALPGYQNIQAISPLVSAMHQPWLSPNMLHAPVSGYHGYYDPILTRDFIPDYSNAALPRVQVPTPRGLIPTGIPGGIMYPGYTPLGGLQILSKRLNIPHGSEEKQARAILPEKKTSEDRTSESKRISSTKNTMKIKRDTSRKESSSEINKMNKETIPHVPNHHGNKSMKRQFILTQPVPPPVQRPIVAFVPVVTNSPVPAPTMTSPHNFVLSLPERTPGTFVLNVPSSPQMFTTTHQLNRFYPSGQFNVLPEYQPNFVAMATQRSGITLPRGVLQGSNKVSLGELTGIMGTPIIRKGPHLTMFYNDHLPSHIEDEIFRDSPVQGRAMIPGRSSLERKFLHKDFEDDAEADDQTNDSDYQTESYDNSPITERINDQGSYTERVLSDGRTVFRKNHVGFGPITVEANTAESASHHNNDATDMNLDSDKRKQIPRPENERVMDRRIEIPTPARVME